MKYTIENTVKVGKRMDVYLDGVAMRHAVEADDDEGYVVSAIVDDRGSIMMRDGEIQYAKKFGKVEVKPRGKNGQI